MTDEDELGRIAARWRNASSSGRADLETIKCVMQEYEVVVNRLVISGKWTEAPPPPEDQLPIDMMPKAYFDYWYMEKKPMKIDRKQRTTVCESIFIFLFVVIGIGIVFFLMSQCGGCFGPGYGLILK